MNKASTVILGAAAIFFWWSQRLRKQPVNRPAGAPRWCLSHCCSRMADLLPCAIPGQARDQDGELKESSVFFNSQTNSVVF